MRRRPPAGSSAREQGAEAVSITSAAPPRSVDIRGRERRYLISMGIRTLCFVAALFTLHHWYVWVFLAAAIFLPYFAVVIANAGANTDPGQLDHPFRPDLKALPHGPGWEEQDR